MRQPGGRWEPLTGGLAGGEAANSGVNLGKLICQVIGPCRLSSPGAGLKGGPSHCVCQPSTGCRPSELNLFIKT